MIKLIHGKDSFLLRSKLNELIKVSLDQNPSIEVEKVDAVEQDLKYISTSVESTSMFAPDRLLVINYPNQSKEKTEIYEYFIEIADQEIPGIEILLVIDEKLSGRLRIVKAIPKENQFKVEELNNRSFSAWAKSFAEEQDLDIQNNDLRYLAEINNHDAERFAKSIEKLQLSGLEKITRDEIDELIEDTSEKVIWTLMDRINKKQSPISFIEQLLEQGMDAMYLLAMIARNNRQLIQVKSLTESNHSYKEIAKLAKVPPFTVKGLQKGAENFSWDQLFTIHQKLLNLDYEIKRGRIDAKLGVTLLGLLLAR